LEAEGAPGHLRRQCSAEHREVHSPLQSGGRGNYSRALSPPVTRC
jgi:hypothetical protein